MKQRIQKILAAAGVASRRAIEEMIAQGRVSVNGKVVIEPPILIDPFKDKVKIDDELVKIDRRPTQDRVYFLMFKPKHVYSTNVAQGEQVRAIDLLPPDFKGRVYPVGRLDAETKGLLLLTNDGELTNQLTHPRYGVSKTYRALIDGSIPPDAVADLEQGVWMTDPHTGKNFRTGKMKVKVIRRTHEQSTLELTLREGRNYHVRRILARFGHKVRDLTRVKFGPLDLDGLKSGDVRTLSLREIKTLRSLGKKLTESPGHAATANAESAEDGAEPAAPIAPRRPYEKKTVSSFKPNPSTPAKPASGGHDRNATNKARQQQWGSRPPRKNKPFKHAH